MPLRDIRRVVQQEKWRNYAVMSQVKAEVVGVKTHIEGRVAANIEHRRAHLLAGGQAATQQETTPSGAINGGKIILSHFSMRVCV